MKLLEYLEGVTRLKGYELSVRTSSGTRIYISEDGITRRTASPNVVRFGTLTTDGDLESTEVTNSYVRIEGGEWELILWPKYEKEQVK